MQHCRMANARKISLQRRQCGLILSGTPTLTTPMRDGMNPPPGICAMCRFITTA